MIPFLSRSFPFVTFTPLAAICVVVGCSESTKLRAPADAIPPSVSIAGTTMTEGTLQGRQRRTTSVSGFAITKTPITVAQYRRCVDGGACSVPAVKTGTCASASGIDGATYPIDGGGDLPVTCARVSQAREYCDWVGGRLPTAPEWLLAARGPTVQPYSWGSSAPSCDLVSRLQFSPSTYQSACAAEDDPEAFSALRYVVGKHSKGVSTSQVSDVLVTRAEIVGADDNAFALPCRSPAQACLIMGWRPGEIGQWLPVADDGGDAPISTGLSAAGFRCAWNGGVQ